MASSAELRQKIAEGQQTFRAAIEAAAGAWEQKPGDAEGEWSPREVAEHALASENVFAGWVAGVMLGKAPERKDLALAGSADALAAMDSIHGACSRVYGWVEDRDLGKRCQQKEHIPQLPATLEGALLLVAHHLNDHARQIQSALATAGAATAGG